MQRIYSIFLAAHLLAATMVIITPSSVAQTASEAWRLSQRDMSMGARMTGMSVRGYAGHGGYSALYSNPAGLGYVNSSQIIVSVQGSTAESDPEFLTNGFALNRTRSSVENSGLGNLALLYNAPVERGKLVAGIGVGQVRNFSRKLDFSGKNTESTITESFLPFDSEYSVDNDGNLEELDDLPFAAFNGGFIEYYKELYDKEEYPFYGAVKPGTTIEQSGLVTESGEVYELSGAVAWQATRYIMAGASVNIIFGNYRFDYLFTETDINKENKLDDYNVLLDDGSLLEGFDQLDYGQRLDTDMVGINFRAGISTELHSRLQLGFTLESPTWTYIEESYGAQFSTRFDRGGEISYGDQSDDVGNGAYEYSMRTPWRLGVGMNFSIGKLTLIGEGELMDWSQLKLNSDEGEDVFRDVNDTIEEEFGITLNAAVGAEFDLRGVDLRAGYAYRSSPYKETESAGSRRLRYGERVGLSFGAGTRITDGIRIDLGLQVETGRDSWDAYPSDSGGARQDTAFLIDELLDRGIAVLELTVNI